MNLAPIVLFVFNRPEHTKNTIESLQRNTLSAQSDLFVFADGARNEGDMAGVEAVQALVDRIEGFRSVTVHKRSSNLGLAASVIAGVSSVIRQYGKVVVVEDDLQFSPYFLEYMNQALTRYSIDHKVFSIGGYSPPLEIPESYIEDSYLSYRCCTWGWATWVDRWEKVDWDVKDYASFIKDPEQVARFNRGGDDMSQIFKLQMAGKVNSWGIRWDYAHFKNDAYCFRPVYSIVSNTGHDGSGIHCGATDQFDVSIDTRPSFAYPEPGQLIPDPEINRRFATAYDGRKRTESQPMGLAATGPSFPRRVVRKLRRLVLG